MSKQIDSLVQASIDSKNYIGVVLVRAEFLGSGGYLRFANTYQTIYWDEGSPNGEVAYLGTGNLGAISILPETAELGAITVDLTLTGIPNDIIADGFSDDYRNQPVYVWYATLDPDTYAVEGGQSGPVLAFAGLMDYATIEFGETATVTITATSRLADWEKPRGGTFNHSYQKTYVDVTDTGFKSVLALQNKEISWGEYSLADPQGSAGGVGCFAYGTKFFMADGSLKEVQDIKVNDVMLGGGKVYHTIIGDGISEDWYNVDGVLVTASHSIYKDNKWMRIRDAGFIETDPKELYYVVANKNHMMIAANNYIFGDMDEADYEDIEWGSLLIDYRNNQIDQSELLDFLKKRIKK